MITIVFLSFHSEHHIRKHILEIDKKFPIIVIDNARNFEFNFSTEIAFIFISKVLIILLKNDNSCIDFNKTIK